ncbi:MAG: Ca2+-binding RTX toxin-like protein [Pseudohongiellaceae bacterium]|jgi:Ca2+-binding RTX toxin-like protein
MAIQYDAPSTQEAVNTQVEQSSFSAETKAALIQLLSSRGGSGNDTVDGGTGTDNPGTVKVAAVSVSSSGVVTIPEPTEPDGTPGRTTDFLLVNIPTPTDETTGVPIIDPTPILLELSPAALLVPVISFDTSTPISVTFNTIPRVILSGRGSDNITVRGDANTTIESAGGNDTLTTSGGEDFITVRAGGNTSVTTAAGNDTIRAGSGNDTIDGGSGLDLLQYSNAGAAYTISKNQTSGQQQVTSADGTQTIVDVERVFFSDKKVALDLMPEQNAAMSIQIINVIGAELRSDPQAVGLILDLFDSGMSLDMLAQYAIDQGWVTAFAGSGSNEDLARIAYTNIYGAAPDEAQLDFALSFMDGRLANFTQAEFIATAARFELNNDAIDLVGLQQTGVEFVV